MITKPPLNNTGLWRRILLPGNKIVNDQINYVIAFYILDIVLVAIDMCLYVRNRRLDRQNPYAPVEDGHSP